MSFNPVSPVSTALSVPLLTFPYVAPTGTNPVATTQGVATPDPVTNEPGGAVVASDFGYSSGPNALLLIGGVAVLAYVLLRKR